MVMPMKSLSSALVSSPSTLSSTLYQNDHEHDPNTTVDEDMHHHVANIQPKHDNLEDTDDRDAKRQRIEPTPLDHTDIEPNGIDEMIPTHDV